MFSKMRIEFVMSVTKVPYSMSRNKQQNNAIHD